jgi:hypothetical protein
MTFTRRRARAVALALFALAFAGPWGTEGCACVPSLMYFPDILREEIRRPLGWVSVPVAAMAAIPIACSATIPPRSLPGAIVYRVLVGGTATAFCVGIVSGGPGSPEIDVEWGAWLYLLGLLVALLV